MIVSWYCLLILQGRNQIINIKWKEVALASVRIRCKHPSCSASEKTWPRKACTSLKIPGKRIHMPNYNSPASRVCAFAKTSSVEIPASSNITPRQNQLSWYWEYQFFSTDVRRTTWSLFLQLFSLPSRFPGIPGSDLSTTEDLTDWKSVSYSRSFCSNR